MAPMRFELTTIRLSVEHSNAQHNPYSHKVMDSRLSYGASIKYILRKTDLL